MKNREGMIAFMTLFSIGVGEWTRTLNCTVIFSLTKGIKGFCKGQQGDFKRRAEQRIK